MILSASRPPLTTHPMTRDREPNRCAPQRGESHPDGLLPVRCFPPSARHAVPQDEFIDPLAALNAAQRRHLFVDGQAELLISRQEPSAPGTGLSAKKHAARSKIDRLFSVEELRPSSCHRRILVHHDRSHPSGVVPCVCLVCNKLRDFYDLANTLALRQFTPGCCVVLESHNS